MEKYLERIELETDPICEMLFCLHRVGINDKYKENLSDYGLELDGEINDWIVKVAEEFKPAKKELLSNYVTEEGFFVLGLSFILKQFNEEITFEEFINAVKKTPNDELIFMLLAPGCEGKLTKEKLSELKKDNKAIDIIEKYFSVASNTKWTIYKILSKPESVREELIELITYFYNKFYKEKEVEIQKFLSKHIKDNEEQLKFSFIKSILQIMPENYLEKILAEKESIDVLISYSVEYGSYFAIGEDEFVIGYRYSELMEVLLGETNSILNQANLLRILSDKTRLKILLEMRSGSKYLTEIAEKLGISNPAVKYHFNKFLSVGLIEIEKLENRIYYRLKKETIVKLIEELKKSFDL